MAPSLPSSKRDRHVRLLLPRSARRDADVDVHVEQVQEALESLLTEAGELAAHQIGDIGRGDAEDRGGVALSPALLRDERANHSRQLRLRETLRGVSEAEVGEDVTATWLELRAGGAARALSGCRHLFSTAEMFFVVAHSSLEARSHTLDVGARCADT